MVFRNSRGAAMVFEMVFRNSRDAAVVFKMVFRNSSGAATFRGGERTCPMLLCMVLTLCDHSYELSLARRRHAHLLATPNVCDYSLELSVTCLEIMRDQHPAILNFRLPQEAPHPQATMLTPRLGNKKVTHPHMQRNNVNIVTRGKGSEVKYCGMWSVLDMRPRNV